MAVIKANLPAVFVNNALEYSSDKDDENWKFILNGVKNLYGNGTEKYFDTMALLIEGGLILFDTDSEAETFFAIFDADLVHGSEVRAYLYDATGKCVNENVHKR
jgi:hypothetical protein